MMGIADKTESPLLLPVPGTAACNNTHHKWGDAAVVVAHHSIDRLIKNLFSTTGTG